MLLSALKMDASIVPCVLIANIFKVRNILECIYSEREGRLVSCPDTKSKNQEVANLLNLIGL